MSPYKSKIDKEGHATIKEEMGDLTESQMDLLSRVLTYIVNMGLETLDLDDKKQFSLQSLSDLISENFVSEDADDF